MDLAKRLGKVGVLVGNCRAFVGNRMFDPYVREAQFLLEEGATIEEVDARPDRLRHGDGPAGRPRPGGPGRRLAHPQGVRDHLNRRAGRRSWPRTGCASWAASARRPGPAGIATRRAAAPRRPTRRRRGSSRRRPARPASRGGRSPRRRSSSGPSTPSSTKGRASWKKASPCGPATSTSSTSTATASPPTAAARCGTPTRWAEEGLRPRPPVRAAARETRGRPPRCLKRLAADGQDVRGVRSREGSHVRPTDGPDRPADHAPGGDPGAYLDEMGHMNVMWYTHLFSMGAWGLFQMVGLDSRVLRGQPGRQLRARTALPLPEGSAGRAARHDPQPRPGPDPPSGGT